MKNEKVRFPFTFSISHSRRAGFTLLELVVVIFILSMLFAVSLPSFVGIGESRLRSEAKRLASILRYLNDSAITTKENLSFTADLKDKALRYTGPDGEKSERFDHLSGIELQSRGLLSEGEVTVFFGPTGAGESFRFHLRDNEQGLTVSLNAMSGRVKIVQDSE